MKFGLENAVIVNINTIFSKYSAIESVVLYGSRAKGTFKAGSDIDLTLVGQYLSYKDLVSISLELDDLLLPYEFDLSIYQDIDNDELLDHINRIGIVFYSKSNS